MRVDIEKYNEQNLQEILDSFSKQGYKPEEISVDCWYEGYEFCVELVAIKKEQE